MIKNLPRLILSLTTGVFLSALLTVFTIDACHRALQKATWTDEHNAIKYVCRLSTYTHLLLHGSGEASPAPLYYWPQKYFDHIREKINWLGLHPAVYYRIISLGLTVLFTAFFYILFAAQILRKPVSTAMKILQCSLLCLAFTALLFAPLTAHYAIEARAYALWNMLWLSALSFALLNPSSKKPLFICLILMALTSTGSIFQIFSMGGAAFITALLNPPIDKKNLWRKSLYFVLPMLLCFYYIPWKSGNLGFPTHLDFLHFWAAQYPLGLLCVAGIAVCFADKNNRPLAIALFSAFLLFLLEPGIAWIALRKGYPVTPRIFIYNDLVFPVFLLTLIQCLPYLGCALPNQKIKHVVIGICVALSAGLFFMGPLPSRVTAALNNTKRHFLSPSFRQEISLSSALPGEIAYWADPRCFWKIPIPEIFIRGYNQGYFDGPMR
ncbi:MAG: hypothetical protein HQL23_06980 [Candidatus Omnitrophica bacterium]|nr:hypothetical protein [Candidatus Omnitrophota bacterium]